jgi:hypothetical protein
MAKGSEKFTGVNSINDYLLISNIENNLKSFLDWGFLNIGGFINVSSTSNEYHNDPSKLGYVSDPNYSDGQVWQTIYQDWVYDNLDDYAPTLITGVNVDGSSVNSSDYILDYVNSRVIFNTAISTSSNVTMNYAYRWVQVHKASSNLVWWKQFQFDIVNDATQFSQNTGEYAIFNQNRIQMPSVIIETVPRGISKPYQLGDKSLIADQDIILHVIATNSAHRNSIIDIIRLQEDKVIWLYDTQKLAQDGILPFNFNGSLNGSRKPYNLIVNDCTDPDPVTNEVVCEDEYRWKTCHLKDFIVSEVESRYFFEEAKIRITAEIIFDTIG